MFTQTKLLVVSLNRMGFKYECTPGRNGRQELLAVFNGRLKTVTNTLLLPGHLDWRMRFGWGIVKIDKAVGINVDNRCLVILRNGRHIATVYVDVAMEHVARLKPVQEGKEYLKARMRQIGPIVNAKWRRVSNEDIQITAVSQLIAQ